MVSLSHVTVGPPIFTLAIVSNACIERPLNFTSGLFTMEALLVMRDSGTDTTSKALTNANELVEGVKVITRVVNER